MISEKRTGTVQRALDNRWLAERRVHLTDLEAGKSKPNLKAEGPLQSCR
jgi:hypothetical protein